jgi:hypothetical protein
MTAEQFPIASVIVESRGSTLGQFIGVNIGTGLICREEGKLAAIDAEVEGYETVHFRCGQASAGFLVLATPGVPSPASMAFFGQLNQPHARTISRIHLHLILAGGGAAGDALTIEVYRRRAGTFTLLATLTLTVADGDNSFDGVTPAGDLALVEAGDYLFCQPTAKDLVTGGGNGITVDVHFATT